MTIIESLAALATPIDQLVFLPGNPRRGDVEAVARSLKRFGQRKPVTANRDGTVTAGNHTLAAARLLGWTEIAVAWTDDDDVEAKAWALADNHTGELGTYDDVDLAAMLAEVQSADADLFAATSWTDQDLADLLASLHENEPTTAGGADPDAIPDPPPATTAPGDVWLLGPHRMMCGDCRSAGDVATLLNGATINLAVTSPPYAEQREYDESSGFKPIPPDEYVEWFEPVAANVAAHLADDGSWFVNIKPPGDGLDTHLYVFDLVIAHVRQWGWHFATEFCWERGGVPKGVTRRFKNQFEPVYQFALNAWKMRPDAVRHWSENVPVNVGPGGGNTGWANAQGNAGGNQLARLADATEGMAYPGNRLPTFNSTHTAVGHTAAFPVGLPAFFVKAYSDPGDTVFDPFMGSGSTLLAAHGEGRIGFGMELSPKYVDVICKRFQQVTGITPILESTGEGHDFSDTP